MTTPSSQIAACVRACAMKNALLQREEWRALHKTVTVSEAAGWMERRGLCTSDPADLSAVERDAHDRVIHDATGLIRFTTGELRQLLLFFVWFYDVLNIQSMIRHIHVAAEARLNPDALFQTGPRGLVDNGQLLSVTNYAALAKLLNGTVLASPLDEAMRRYREDGSVARFLETVDAGFLSEWTAAAARCGFRLKGRTDGTGLSVFLVSRIIESVVRLKAHRGAETSRLVPWLSMACEAGKVDAILAALSSDSAQDARRELAAVLLPAERSTRGASQNRPVSLPRMVFECAGKGVRGVAFTAEFLTSFLVLLGCQARELTLLLESKDSGLAAADVSAFMEDAA